ncbi:PAS domain S-box protein, putative [Babesia ovis]|uniref:PAS domain S-box protein, putative n=1 Tax=Babesia ovis TaxID=5869 RepID=A0A9W5TDM7_BABOV|nr:PAS domain S-box protein, putative [Babesia ovis]
MDLSDDRTKLVPLRHRGSRNFAQLHKHVLLGLESLNLEDKTQGVDERNTKGIEGNSNDVGTNSTGNTSTSNMSTSTKMENHRITTSGIGTNSGNGTVTKTGHHTTLSTYKADFVRHDLPRQGQPCKPQPRKSHVPFTAVSTYRMDFRNLGCPTEQNNVPAAGDLAPRHKGRRPSIMFGYD